MLDILMSNMQSQHVVLLFFKIIFLISSILMTGYTIIVLFPKMVKDIVRKPRLKPFIVLTGFISLCFFEVTRNIIIVICFTILAVFGLTFVLAGFSAIVRKIKNKKNPKPLQLYEYPEITILYALKNESKVIGCSIDKLFEINYPKDKIKIMIVDDH